METQISRYDRSFQQKRQKPRNRASRLGVAPWTRQTRWRRTSEKGNKLPKTASCRRERRSASSSSVPTTVSWVPHRTRVLFSGSRPLPLRFRPLSPTRRDRSFSTAAGLLHRICNTPVPITGPVLYVVSRPLYNGHAHGRSFGQQTQGQCHSVSQSAKAVVQGNLASSINTA